MGGRGTVADKQKAYPMEFLTFIHLLCIQDFNEKYVSIFSSFSLKTS